MDRALVWLWLSLLYGAGNDIYGKLITYFEDEQSIYDCDDSDMGAIRWLSDSQKAKLLNKNLDHAYEVLEWCEENDVQIIAYSDENYPQALRELRNFPAVLYCKGDFPDFNEELSISVVGTRSMTNYGQKVAFELGYTLSRGGAITVGGMARGIDSTAALGTINALGRTVAVLGSGIDIIYPRENASLMNKIIENGAVITEYPPHTPPNSWNFPVRNRIISGISNGTVIVEASFDSGAMITARRASEQRKPVFSVPGPARMHASSGTNQLIREGAKLTSDALDVLEEFLEDYSDKIDLTKAKARPRFSRDALKVASGIDRTNFYKKSIEDKKNIRKQIRKFEEIVEPQAEEDEDIDTSALSETELKIFNSMEKRKPYCIDELVALTSLEPSEVISSVGMLQINGFVSELPGSYFVKH